MMAIKYDKEFIKSIQESLQYNLCGSFQMPACYEGIQGDGR
jgi:hypothetical protein